MEAFPPDATLCFARHWSLRYSRFHFESAERAIWKELEEDLVELGEIDPHPEAVAGQKLYLDTLPVEIILKIIARVPFSRTSILNLRTINSKIKRVIDGSRGSLFKAIGNLQFTDALLIDGDPDSPTFVELIQWRRVTLENRWIIYRIKSTFEAKGLLFEQHQGWEKILNTGLNLLRVSIDHRKKVKEDLELPQGVSKVLFSEMARAQLGVSVNSIIRFTVCKISECLDYLGLYFISCEDSNAWNLTLPGTWTSEDSGPLHLEDMITRLGFKPLLTLLHPISPMSSPNDQQAFIQALVDYSNIWFDRPQWMDIVAYADLQTERELPRLKYGLMASRPRQRMAASASISSSLILQKYLWNTTFGLDAEQEYTWKEYREAERLHAQGRARQDSGSSQSQSGVDIYDRTVAFLESHDLSRLHHAMSRDGLLSKFLSFQDASAILQGAITNLSHLRHIYRVSHQGMLHDHDVCREDCSRHVDFIKTFRMLYEDLKLEDLT